MALEQILSSILIVTKLSLKDIYNLAKKKTNFHHNNQVEVTYFYLSKEITYFWLIQHEGKP